MFFATISDGNRMTRESHLISWKKNSDCKRSEDGGGMIGQFEIIDKERIARDLSFGEFQLSWKWNSRAGVENSVSGPHYCQQQPTDYGLDLNSRFKFDWTQQLDNSFPPGG